MADLPIAPADVVARPNASVERGTAAVAVEAGETVYLSTVTRKWALSASNLGTAQARTPGGLALNTAAPNQPLFVAKGGGVEVGAVLDPGVAYYQSGTPGALCLFEDLDDGEYVTLVGIAQSDSLLAISIQATSVEIGDGPEPTAPRLQLEDGASSLLLESGDFLTLE